MNVDIYVEKENGEISLQEWLDYVKSDDALVLEEVAEGINPLTKQKLGLWKSVIRCYGNAQEGN